MHIDFTFLSRIVRARDLNIHVITRTRARAVAQETTRPICAHPQADANALAILL